MRTTIRGAWVLFFVLAACAQEKQSTDKFFDFQGFIDEQISQLSQHGRALEKTSNVKNIQSDSAYVPSLDGWAAELELFRQLENINKPTLKSQYHVEDAMKDTKSNLKIRQYTSATAPIRSIKFYYQGSFTQLKKIEATVQEDNMLYANGRVLTMEFEEEDRKPLLHYYTMTGFQKMILRDTVNFSLQGQIDL